jgi:hypothetical protein
MTETGNNSLRDTDVHGARARRSAPRSTVPRPRFRFTGVHHRPDEAGFPISDRATGGAHPRGQGLAPPVWTSRGLPVAGFLRFEVGVFRHAPGQRVAGAVGASSFTSSRLRRGGHARRHALRSVPQGVPDRNRTPVAMPRPHHPAVALCHRGQFRRDTGLLHPPAERRPSQARSD